MTLQDVKKGDLVQCVDGEDMWHISTGHIYTVVRCNGNDVLTVINDQNEPCAYSLPRFKIYRTHHEDPFKALEDALQRCIQKSEDNIKSMRECLKSIQSPTS